MGNIATKFQMEMHESNDGWRYVLRGLGNRQCLGESSAMAYPTIDAAYAAALAHVSQTPRAVYGEIHCLHKGTAFHVYQNVRHQWVSHVLDTGNVFPHAATDLTAAHNRVVAYLNKQIEDDRLRHDGFFMIVWRSAIEMRAILLLLPLWVTLAFFLRSGCQEAGSHLTPYSVTVSGYYRSDGTYVRPHRRRPPGAVSHDRPYLAKRTYYGLGIMLMVVLSSGSLFLLCATVHGKWKRKKQLREDNPFD